MTYTNEQIIKTFEHLFNLHYKYASINSFITTPTKSRTLYRINQEKLEKYRSQFNSIYNSKPLRLDENKVNRKTKSTQTTFNKQCINTHNRLFIKYFRLFSNK